MTTQPQSLLFYQDFDHLEVGAYTSVENMLGGNITLANSSAASGSVFEICEEANGNKYLKVTGQTYQGFSVFFEKVGCAVISMEYKFPENNTGLVNMTRVRFNDSQWGVDGDGWEKPRPHSFNRLDSTVKTYRRQQC